MKRGVYRTTDGRFRARPWDPKANRKIHLGYFGTEAEAQNRCNEYYKALRSKAVSKKESPPHDSYREVGMSTREPAEYQEISGNEGVFITNGSRITTLDQLVKAMQVDLDVWEIYNHSISKSEVAIADGNGGVNVEPLFHIKAQTRKKKPSSIPELIVTGALEQIKEYAPVYTPVQNYNYETNGDLLLEICIPDLHLGKLCWGAETGVDYDLKIAKEVYAAALLDLLSTALHYGGISRILLPIGNDFFHVDNGRNTTTAGTLVDVDGRYQKAYKEGGKLLTESVDILQCHAPVDIVVVAGNHDHERMFYVGNFLEAWYHGSPNIKIDNAEMTRKYYDWGKVLLGYTHGNEEKRNDLLMLMATEEPERWGRSRFREWHVGHWHSKRSIRFQEDTYELVDTRVRVIPSLSAPDAWHARKGYLGSRGAEAFLWDKEKGCKMQFFHNIPRI